MRHDTITTARLHLRPVTIGDAEAITDIVADPRVHRMVARIAPGQTKAQTLAWISTLDRARTDGTDFVFAVIQDDAFVGLVGAHRDAQLGIFELGYWFSPDVWGSGIASESAGALLEWLEARGERAFTSGYFVDNPASGNVLRRLGFIPADRRPVFCLGRGEAVDHFYMARISETA